MSIKILTKNSTEITNIDGARNNNFNSAMRSGIVKGAFNEGNFFSASSNVIVLDTCELIISGHRVVIDSAESITLTNRPSTATRYSMIAEISVNDLSIPSFRLFIQSSNVELIQQNLYTNNVGKGVYQLEIGKFTLQRDGTITDIVRTADLIVGGFSDKISAILNIGTITTNTLEPGMEAEVDVEQRLDEDSNKTLTDFTFSIPRGKGDPNTLTIGTITSGETASATITGESPNQVLNLVLPRGEQGVQGEQGIQGQQGIQGEQGVQGEQGDSVELRTSDGYIQWKTTTSTTWNNLLPLSELNPNENNMFINIMDYTKFNPTNHFVSESFTFTSMSSDNVLTVEFLSDLKTYISSLVSGKIIKAHISFSTSSGSATINQPPILLEKTAGGDGYLRPITNNCVSYSMIDTYNLIYIINDVPRAIFKGYNTSSTSKTLYLHLYIEEIN